MAESQEFCLLVNRAGSTTICKLTPQGLRFGYAPPAAEDLTLYDGALADIHGVIEYDASADKKEAATLDTTAPATNARPIPYRLSPRAANVRIDGAELPPRGRVAVQLWTGNKIQVGDKYILTVAEYQPTPGNGVMTALPAPPAPTTEERPILYLDQPPPFLSHTSQLFLRYLPEIYQPAEIGGNNADHFLPHFLALLESVFIPLTWNVENFDLLLHPDSAPPYFLPWLAGWYGLPFDITTLTEKQQRNLLEQQRNLLRQTPALLIRRGTVAGLADLLEACTGQRPQIKDWVTEKLDEKNSAVPANERVKFRVIFGEPLEDEKVKKQVLQLIDLFKPAHAQLDLQDGWQP